jgi:hypothetical protein
MKQKAKMKIEIFFIGLDYNEFIGGKDNYSGLIEQSK